jgi:hypothetical protein
LIAKAPEREAAEESARQAGAARPERIDEREIAGRRFVESAVAGAESARSPWAITFSSAPPAPPPSAAAAQVAGPTARPGLAAILAK